MRLRLPRRRPRMWRVTILVLAALYFLGPIAASIRFSLIQNNGKDGLGNYTQVLHDALLSHALGTSLEIAGIATGDPARADAPDRRVGAAEDAAHRVARRERQRAADRDPADRDGRRARGAAEERRLGTQGLLFNSPLTGLTPFYVILALPFAYRSLDTGVRAIDLRTLVDAARSLGAGWFTLIVRVILPNVRTAVLTAASLSIALVLAEVVIAGTLLYDTFPVELVNQAQENTGLAVALSVLTLLITWLLLFAITFLGNRGSRARVGRLI